MDDSEIRLAMQQELAPRHSMAPGILRAWHPQPDGPAELKEVIAILRPERWPQTKVRVQRLRLPAFTQHRVLGRGRARGLRYLPRQGAASGTGVRYLPKRMVSWIVEASCVEPLVQAVIEANRTGRVGDGKIFVLPVEDAIRVRTDERGCAALHVEGTSDVIGRPQTAEAIHAARQ